MSTGTRLILKKSSAPERWEHRERGDYTLERFDREFQERLYSDKGREILHGQQGKTPECGNEPKP